MPEDVVNWRWVGGAPPSDAESVAIGRALRSRRALLADAASARVAFQPFDHENSAVPITEGLIVGAMEQNARVCHAVLAARLDSKLSGGRCVGHPKGFVLDSSH